jgi:predicted DNA-binding protein (UPF0251 family)
MPRPLKTRRVCYNPGITYFKPKGIPVLKLEEVVLSTDELEAVRLADLIGLYQEQAAGQMDISRQTFGNIINSAHLKIADALVNGKALRIEGGKITGAERHFQCSRCKHQWTELFAKGRPERCPECSSPGVYRSDKDIALNHSMDFNFANGRCKRRSA